METYNDGRNLYVKHRLKKLNKRLGRKEETKMGQVVGKKKKDDVTQWPLTLISSANSPSISDEPSMSSSIIETSLVNEENHLFKGHVGVEADSNIIPKRAWSGYHLFQLSNIKENSPARIIRTPKVRNKVKREEDMDQLITMMKNHTVSDNTGGFDFNFTKPLTPQNSPQKKAEFKFSFTVPQHGYLQEQVYEQQSKQKEYDERVSNRKILPLPKPRLLKSSNIPLPASNNMVFNTATTTDPTSIDRDNKKKMKCSDSLKTDNKRKERNWKDSTIIANELVHKVPDTSSIGKLLNTKKTEPKITAFLSTTDIKKTKKKMPKKTKNKNKQKNKEEIAPGGFLSSDINLFENPISDDWICLFCQYDILFNGLSDTRKKNHRRRKREKVN